MTESEKEFWDQVRHNEIMNELNISRNSSRTPLTPEEFAFGKKVIKWFLIIFFVIIPLIPVIIAIPVSHHYSVQNKKEKIERDEYWKQRIENIGWKPDSTQVIPILNQIHNMEEPLLSAEQLRNYGYGSSPRDKATCIDYSFAFVALYGDDAVVIANDRHAWVEIKDWWIEPQDLQMINKKNAGGLYGGQVKRITLQSGDVRTIRNHFRR